MEDRFADIQLLRYKLKDFDTLTLQQKLFIYCLSQATLWGRDITFDQFGRYNLKIRRLLEAIYANIISDKTTVSDSTSVATPDSVCNSTSIAIQGSVCDSSAAALIEYLKRIWFSSGIYHHYSCKKFLPSFTKDYFISQVKALPFDVLPLDEGETVDSMLETLIPVIFDPNILPQRVNQADGEDLVKTSACNYYEGVSQQEVTDFYNAKKKSDNDPSWGLNTRLVKRDGKLEEETCCIGGRYSAYIEKIVYWLKESLKYAEDDQQKKVITLLIDYYTTGDLKTFDDYSIAWVSQTQPRVDFINGFIEVYGDPMGLKGSWEGIVHYKDLEATHRTEVLSKNAQWFEDQSPVDPRFKKPVVKGVTANVVCAAMLGGDEYPSSAIGINLPNADWIRAKHGSKSITISNLTAAYDEAAKGNGFRQEYINDSNVIDLVDKYAHLTNDLHTDLHECLGHGSGQLLPGVAADAVKSYASTIEEARADLFGLYYIADEQMVKLGLLPDMEAYKAQYYTYMLNGLLTQCVRIPLGEDIQEAHMRNRALIANWCYEKGRACQVSDDTSSEIVPDASATVPDGSPSGLPVMEFYTENDKTYLRINDYSRLRQLIGDLLAEIQRIKSEGDLAAARDIVEHYAVKLNPDLHKEIKSRYDKLNIAPYKGFINPILNKVCDNDGNIIDIMVDDTESYTAQMLRYSRDYSI